MKARTRLAAWLSVALLLVAALAYLHDPPWLGRVTSGLGAWQEDESGTRFRWTAGHASFYVPANAVQVTVPVRLGVPRIDGLPVQARIAVDGRVLCTLVLDDPQQWVPVTFSPGRAPARRAVLVEIFVNRLLRHRQLGIQVGEPVLWPAR